MSEQEKVATAPADGEPSLEWLQREARLEDWDEELKNLEGDIAALEFAELASGDEVRVGDAEGDGGEPREIGTDLVVERDQLKRRIEMERSSVRRALGEEGDHEGTTSYRYDEWDFHNGAYLRGWCRLYEERLHGGDADTQALLDTVRPFARAVRRRFEEVRPAGYQRVKKTPDGDELDIDTLVDTARRHPFRHVAGRARLQPSRAAAARCRRGLPGRPIRLHGRRPPRRARGARPGWPQPRHSRPVLRRG